MDSESSFSWPSTVQNPKTSKLYEQEIRTCDASVGSFLSLDIERGRELRNAAAPEGVRGDLADLPFAVKDNIAIEGFPLTCGSRMLEAFTSPYTATAVKRLLSAGAVPIGKTNLDEFGMGSGTENSALQETCNPWNPDHVPGGSSGGSAAAVAAGMVPFALGSDTGGSIRQPANFCGVYGLKPTYGAVSRFGLVAYASSLECIGILSDTPQRAEAVFQAVCGADPADQTSRTAPHASGRKRKLRIGMLGGTEGLDRAVEQALTDAAGQYRQLGFSVEPVEMDTFEYVVPAYYTIAAAEASANLARYTGIRYGHRSTEARDVETMTRMTREEGFGSEVKLRILLGTYVLRSGFQDQYYVRAQKIRTKIRRDIARLFSEVDLLMMPVFPTQAFPRGGEGLTAFQQKLADRYTITANLAGIPAMSIPTGVSGGLPVGIQLLAPEFREIDLFAAAKIYAEAYPAAESPLRMKKEKLYGGV